MPESPCPATKTGVKPTPSSVIRIRGPVGVPSRRTHTRPASLCRAMLARDSSPHDGVLVRVAQESLANIARHSDASQVWVRLDGTPAGPRIRITDDGVGFTPVFAAGHGLSGMRDRLAEIGGSLRVDSAPGKGCTVTAVVPS